MKDALSLYLKRYSTICPEITTEELHYVAQYALQETLYKHAVYLSAGKVQTHLSFVVSGLIRVFQEDEQGNENTISFIQENEYVTHYPSFSLQVPSPCTFQCLEDTCLIHLPYDKMQEGIHRYKNLERYARIFKERVSDNQQRRIESLLKETAEQRYLHFIQQHPTLFHRISLTHLASYLGIGRQSLSRIRKHISISQVK
ncbi:MAG: Crp/Fnr family transcriptional regulator [Cytophagaceae bacterium]|jgi:CRP-like cAMP-binding protein|nr:Crp/Fnr family transcriptional regulator [Cytophagaceae bacterium]